MTVPKPKSNKRSTADGRDVHDIGGLPGGAIDRSEHELTLYEKRVDALMNLLAGPKRNAFKVDALRRVIEGYAEQEYDALPYYDKWVRAIRNLLIEQDVISRSELEVRIAAVRKGLEEEGVKVSRKKVPWS
jgi:hypothetical protein